MSRQSHSILVELASALGGFAGIPHDARLFLQACWQTEGLEPTGLLFDIQGAVLDHRFSTSAEPSKRLENHAAYLFKLTRKNHGSRNRLRRLVQKIRRAWRLAFGLKGRMQLADNAAHGESIWRLFLEPSLGDAGLEIARNCPMMLANLSRTLLKLRAWLRLPSLSLDTRGYDFLLLHEPVPLRVRPETCKLIRYYDLIPALRPEAVGSQSQIEAHMRGLRRCRDAVLVCNSEPTRADLVRHFPEHHERAVVIPNLLSTDMATEAFPELLPSIVKSRQAAGLGSTVRFGKTPPPYLLTVATLEPRKNHLQLIRAYERWTARQRSKMILVFVGAAGWHNDEIHQAMRPLLRQGRLIYLQNVPLQELRVLYSHAEALVFPSFYEGFGYAPLEAMQCGCPVLASDIPTHRWVYGDAAHYFDPFSVPSLTESFDRLFITEHPALRRTLIARGRIRNLRYSIPVVGPQWRSLCDEIVRQGGARNVRNLKLANWHPPATPDTDRGDVLAVA